MHSFSKRQGHFIFLAGLCEKEISISPPEHQKRLKFELQKYLLCEDAFPLQCTPFSSITDLLLCRACHMRNE